MCLGKEGFVNMNTLLIFFALPIATIIISIALQKILKCPPLVAGIIFAIFLIVTFIVNNLNFLIATIIYTIISFITAILVCVFCKLLKRFGSLDCSSCRICDNNQESQAFNDTITIDSAFRNNDNNGVLTLNAFSNGNGNCSCSNNNDSCNCNCSNNNNNCCGNSNNNCSSNNLLNARINVIPNQNTNGRTGCLCGNYRRR